MTAGTFRVALVAWLLVLALMTRISAFGDGAYSDDEAFYFLVGLKMHDGLLPYVDIWDRKGPGLFALYYAITAVSRSFVASQIAALIAATLTALTIAAMGRMLSNRAGAVLAGSAYLAMLPLYGGAAGQSPAFYNLLVALAALLVLRSRDGLRAGRVEPAVYLAMASAGLALTFKQTVLPEALFLGGFCLWLLHRAGRAPAALARTAVLLGLAGIAPMAIFALAIAGAGHFAQFWQAMVGANLRRAYYPAGDTLRRAFQFLAFCIPPTALALGGLVARGEQTAGTRGFLGGWLLASVAGVMIVPNFFQHYALPLLVPACVAASRLMVRDRVWNAFAVAMPAFALVSGPAFAFSDRAQSRGNLDFVANEIRRRDSHPRLLIYEGPVDLYRRVGSTPPTPLLFPMHMFHVYESRTSPLDTAGQMRKVLAWRPTVVVKYDDLGAGQENPATLRLVQRYVARCRPWFSGQIDEAFARHHVVVYGDCTR